MEQWLIDLVGLVVVGAIALALLRWLGWEIPSIVWTIAGYLIGGILIVFLIRLLWPLLVGGSLPSFH